MLQQTFEALDKAFAEDNDACIDCAKAMVEVVCRVIVDELDSPTAPVKPPEANPPFGMWVSAAVRALKLGDNRHSAFQKMVSQHHKLTESLGALRNDAGPVSHGRDGFISRLSAYHRRAAVLSADAIVSFLHQAYLDADLNLAQTREPYERFAAWHEVIDRHIAVAAENGESDFTLIFRLPEQEEIALTVEPSRLLFQLDRQAYIAAFEAAKEADAKMLPDVEDLE